MHTQSPISTDILLLGAGHAHVEVLRRFAMRPLPGVRLTLVAREPATPYSGMLPGLIRGDYLSDQAHIDCAQLAAAAGARLILAEATGIDLGNRLVRVAGSRPDVAFDVLSIDVGGQPAVAGGGLPVKPIGRFLDQLAALEARLDAGARVAVVGGGAGGTELALALARRFAGRLRVALVNRDAEPVATAPPGVRRVLRRALLDAGVELVSGVAAGRLADGRLELSDGSFLDAAAALWATGVVAPAFLAAAGLDCDEAGCVRVDATLRSRSHPFVFAAGDCAALQGDPRPKAGVWAVRAGAPLAANLRRVAAGRAPRPWRPQREALVILGLGGGRAVAWRNGFFLAGPLAWRWKDWIDRRWMRMYQLLRPMPMEAEARCGGCGAKLGPAALHDVLAGLGAAARDDIPLGLAAADDAAVALPPPGMAVVQSVDHFRAFIDDPYLFGQIAAAHALSDIHAMGARPWTALAVAAVPYMHGRRMQQDLAAMMRGAVEVLAADGCSLVGGHSAEAAEAALGFAVTGLADPATVWRKSGLRPGDALVLTKPIGTGIVLAAAMRGLAKAGWLQAATDSMRRSNADAARVLRGFGVTACTDVTGFGLGGHLREMLVASGASAVVEVAAVKLLPGAAELSDLGVASTLAPENQAMLGVPEQPGVAFLVDPQTSGGLLAGVPGQRAAACVAALRDAGVDAFVVGSVAPPREPRISLRSIQAT